MATGDRYRDNEGDVWTEQPDGSYVLTESEESLNLGSHCTSFYAIETCFGPLAELDPEPTYVTRTELGDMLHALADEILTAEDSADLSVRVRDMAYRLKGSA